MNGKYFVTGIFLLLFFLYSFSINQILHGTNDTDDYLEITKSFYLGNGYRRISRIDNPTENIILPIYPIVLAPVFIFDDFFLAGRFISVLFALVTLFVFYSICQKFFDRRVSLIVVLLFGLSPLVMIYSHRILTEIPFTFFSLTALLFTLEYAKGGRLRFLFLSLLFVTLATFTRIVGVTLLLSILLYFLFKRDYIRAVPYLIILLLFLAFLYDINYYWISKVSVIEKPGGHGVRTLFVKYPETPPLISIDTLKIVGSNSLGYFIFDVPSNLAPFLIPFRDVVFPVIPYQTLTFRNLLVASPSLTTAFTLFAYGAGLAIFLVILNGYSHRIHDELNVMHIYTFMLIAFILLVPVYPGNGRFILPVMPLIFIYFFSGLRCLDNFLIDHLVFYKNRKSFIRKLFFYFILISTLVSAFSLAFFFHNQKTEPKWNSFFESLEWIQKNTKPDDIIASSKTNKVFLHTGRKGVDVGKINTLDDIQRFKIDYLSLNKDFSPGGFEKITDIVTKESEFFQRVYVGELNHSIIYQVINE